MEEKKTEDARESGTTHPNQVFRVGGFAKIKRRVFSTFIKTKSRKRIGQTGRNHMEMLCKNYPEPVLQIGIENASQMTSPGAQIGPHIFKKNTWPNQGKG